VDEFRQFDNSTWWCTKFRWDATRERIVVEMAAPTETHDNKQELIFRKVKAKAYFACDQFLNLFRTINLKLLRVYMANLICSSNSFCNYYK